ncbi:MAG TPA: VWA domain-containing protein [Thermoanaerobaculia bacterium]|nr:VWA domain-containing protein [Thermoanaerobaculia bacterium]
MRDFTRRLSILLVLAVPVTGQDPIAPLVERIEVRVVNVDVTVTDREGRPVPALGPEDFEIFEDGVRQEITGFYEIRDAAVTVGMTGEVEPEPVQQRFRRRMVLLFDNNSVSKAHRNGAIEYVNDFIDNEFSEDYEWSVIATGGPNVRTLQSFTNDKDAIRSALLKVRSMPTFEHQRAIRRDILADPARAKLQEFDSGYDFGETARFVGREQTMRNMMASAATARAIIQTCRAFSAAPGKKVMLLITGGIDLNTTFGAFEQDRDRKLLEMRREIEQVFDHVVREANASDFNVYVVQAGGLQSQASQHDVSNKGAGLGGTMSNPFFGDGYTKTTDVKDLDSVSLTLALGTGGRYLPGNRVSESLVRVDDSTSNFYSLGYRPAGPEDGRYHRIEVRAKRPGLRVRHREGYAAFSEHLRLERSLRSPLTFAKEKGSLPVTIELGDAPGRSGKTRTLPVIAAIPANLITFLPANEHYLGRIHVYVAVYDDEGENIAYHYQAKDLDVPAAQIGQVAQIPFRYQADIPLARGSYTIVITMRDELSDQFGTAFQDVRI